MTIEELIAELMLEDKDRQIKVANIIFEDHDRLLATNVKVIRSAKLTGDNRRKSKLLEK